MRQEIYLVVGRFPSGAVNIVAFHDGVHAGDAADALNRRAETVAKERGDAWDKDLFEVEPIGLHDSVHSFASWRGRE